MIQLPYHMGSVMLNVNDLSTSYLYNILNVTTRNSLRSKYLAVRSEKFSVHMQILCKVISNVDIMSLTNAIIVKMYHIVIIAFTYCKANVLKILCIIIVKLSE